MLICNLKERSSLCCPVKCSEHESLDTTKHFSEQIFTSPWNNYEILHSGRNLQGSLHYSHAANQLQQTPAAGKVTAAQVCELLRPPHLVHNRSGTATCPSSPDPAAPSKPMGLHGPPGDHGAQVLAKGSPLGRDPGTSSCHFRRYNLVPAFFRKLQWGLEETKCSHHDMVTCSESVDESPRSLDKRRLASPPQQPPLSNISRDNQSHN